MSYLGGGAEFLTSIREIFKPNPARKEVARIIDLSNRKVLNRTKADEEGFSPFISTAALNINSLSIEAGVSVEEKVKFVEGEVNRKRKQYGLPMNFDFFKEKPYRTKKIPGGEMDFWSCGLGAKYTQRKKGAEQRNVNVGVSLTKIRMKNGGEWYQLQRDIERIY